MASPDWPEEFDALVAAVAIADEPYEASGGIPGSLLEYLPASVVASRLYELWTGLQDWYELKPGDRDAAVDAMRRAANEWKSARAEPSAVESFLDHWQYDVLGHDR